MATATAAFNKAESKPGLSCPSPQQTQNYSTPLQSFASSSNSVEPTMVPETLRYGPRELRHLKALGYNIDALASAQDSIKASPSDSTVSTHVGSRTSSLGAED